MTIGVLALQGDVREHRAALEDLGRQSRPVRAPADLEGISGLILPGGESTTLSLLLLSSGLFEPISDGIRSGLPIFGTCAGLVLLAERIRGGRPDQVTFSALNCTVQRNGYGRQAFSFESSFSAPLVDEELGTHNGPIPAVFIRAPLIEEVGAGVEVLASLAGSKDGILRPVICRQANVLAAAFHPELTRDRRMHQLFVNMTNR